MQDSLYHEPPILKEVMIMPYELTSEEVELRQRVRKLVVEKIAPGAQEREETEKFPCMRPCRS